MAESDAAVSATPSDAQPGSTAAPQTIVYGAMPGGIHVATAETLAKGVIQISTLSGLGRRTGLLGADHKFNRAIGDIAFAYGVTDMISVGLSLDGRYDKHWGIPKSGEDGYVGDPHLNIRIAKTSGLNHFGGQIGVWLPGSNAPSGVGGAISVDVRGLVSIPRGPRAALVSGRIPARQHREERRQRDEPVPAGPRVARRLGLQRGVRRRAPAVPRRSEGVDRARGLARGVPRRSAGGSRAARRGHAADPRRRERGLPHQPDVVRDRVPRGGEGAGHRDGTGHREQHPADPLRAGRHRRPRDPGAVRRPEGDVHREGLPQAHPTRLRGSEGAAARGPVRHGRRRGGQARRRRAGVVHAEELAGAGAGDATLDLARGETASIAKAGELHPVEAIPTYYDLRVTVGEIGMLTIHDPKGATAVKLDFGGKCTSGGVIEMDHDGRFRTAKVSAGKDSANVLATAGGVWFYRLRCSTGGGEGAAVASGRMLVVRDDGRRPLPKEPPHFPIDTDGRTYRTGYQSLIPNMKINTTGSGGGTYTLHLATGGTEQTFESTKPSFDVPGSKLKEGTFTYWVEHAGQKSKISTLILEFDQKAAQVYIEAPANGAPWTGDIEVRGATLPGWTAKIDVNELPVDSKNRFHATV